MRWSTWTRVVLVVWKVSYFLVFFYLPSVFSLYTDTSHVMALSLFLSFPVSQMSLLSVEEGAFPQSTSAKQVG